MSQPHRDPVTDPTVIDLFSGAGGLSLGAARAGFAIVGAVELDKRALAAHKRNFPNTAHVATDLAGASGEELAVKFAVGVGEFAGIIGGPPCQGFSCMGKRNREDPRNSLFGHFFRLVAELRPRFFLAENVPGILGENHAATLRSALKRVEADYAVLRPMTLAAHDYGAPTTRKRVFLFGCRRDCVDGLTEASFAPPQETEKTTVCEALRGLPSSIKPEWLAESQGWRKVGKPESTYFGQRLHGEIPEGVGDATALAALRHTRRVAGCLGTRHTPEVVKRYARLGPGERDGISKAQRLDPDGYCPTLRAGTGKERGSYQAVRPVHPTQNRVITPREAARLQGFPDWFQFDGTKWHSFRQIGNSVSPILAERLLRVVRSALGT